MQFYQTEDSRFINLAHVTHAEFVNNQGEEILVLNFSNPEVQPLAVKGKDLEMLSAIFQQLAEDFQHEVFKE